MEKKLQTLRYLTKSLSAGIFVGFVLILSTVAVTDLVYYFTDQRNPVHPVVPLTVPFEATAGIFALVIGMAHFIGDFKVVLANGVSRKTYLFANLPTAFLMAAVLSLFNLIVQRAHSLFWPINAISDLFYLRLGWIEALLFQFVLYFLLIILGRVITLAYYRSSTIGKWGLSIAPFAIFGVFEVANARFGGMVFKAIDEYFYWSLSMPTVVPVLFVYAAAFYGLTYLLIRRAPLKG